MKHLKAGRMPADISNRAGFTLIELLMVIAILGLLATITFVAFGPAGQSARITRTRATIQKVMGMLQQHKEDIARSDGDPAALRLTTARSNARGVNIPGSVAVIFARKVQMKKTIPQRAEDVFARLAGQDISSDGIPSFERADGEDDVLSLKAESAELLYAFLTGGKFKVKIDGTDTPVEIGNISLGTENASSSALKSNEVADTDGDGQLELVDGWGEPLRFYRWPTRLIRPDTNGDGMLDGSDDGVNPRDILKTVMSNVPRASDLQKDPDDPLDDLSTYDGVLGRSGRNQNPFDDLSEVNYHTPNTYHTFLLVSAGQDKKLGLEEPSDTDVSNGGNWGFLAQPLSSVLADPLNSELNDNITNLQEDLSK